MTRRRKRELDFQTVMYDMLMDKAKDANGAQIQINGKDATYLQVLCKQILNKSFKDANLGWRVLVKAGVIPVDDKADTGLNNFLNKLTKTN